MKEYPSIDRKINDKFIYAFDKMDGSNIRVEWNRKTGFSKFGSRTCRIDETHQLLGESLQIFKDKYEKDLIDIFKSERWEQVTCFLEFFGKNSFAGNHIEEQHDLVLFDASIYKKGFLLPQDFLKIFANVNIAKLLYKGKCNQNFLEEVQTGRLDGMTFEGVVCKSNEYKLFGLPYMFKVKNKAWIEKLKEKCGNNVKLFESLV